MAGAGAVAEAVGGVTEEGAAAHDADLAEGVGLAENFGGGPLAAAVEVADFGLADAGFGAGGVGVWVF